MRMVWGVVLVCLAAVSGLYAEDCEGHPATYRAAAEDAADGLHVSAARRFAGTGEVTINVNRGELRVERAEAAGELRVRITSRRPEKELVKTLRRFEVAEGSATVDVCLADKEDVVTVFVPSSAGLTSDVNLGAGTLVLRAEGLEGSRRVNVGAGTLKVYLAGEGDYASLRTNVGMGRMLDRRANGKSSYGATARSMSGSGRGSMELNMGAGEIELVWGG